MKRTYFNNILYRSIQTLLNLISQRAEYVLITIICFIRRKRGILILTISIDSKPFLASFLVNYLLSSILLYTINSATVCSLTVPVPSLDKGGGWR